MYLIIILDIIFPLSFILLFSSLLLFLFKQQNKFDQNIKKSEPIETTDNPHSCQKMEPVRLSHLPNPNPWQSPENISPRLLRGPNISLLFLLVVVGEFLNHQPSKLHPRNYTLLKINYLKQEIH